MDLRERNNRELSMKKTILAVMMVLLVTTFCFAQVPRNPVNNTYYASGYTTSFTNIGSLGFDVVGNPGYIALSGSDVEGNNSVYYLWVSRDGYLLIASGGTLDNFASFPTGDWRTMDEDQADITKVGAQ